MTTLVKEKTKKGPKPCKALPAGVNKEMLQDAHRAKMEAKKMINAHNREQFRDGRYILANISQNHPDYGDTPAEQEANKQARKDAEKSS